FMGALHRLTLGERGRHDKTPNDSSSMAHIHDVADLFMAAYENPDASGRYYAVYDSWHWQDIYDVLTPLMPEMVTPEPWTGDKATPTGFDFTRRDSLGVNMRDIPMALTETVRWLQGHPFAT
ncbi:MAG: dihydroflavonol 4-reductase, partial [Pseudomonadota bacterium]